MTSLLEDWHHRTEVVLHAAARDLPLEVCLVQVPRRQYRFEVPFVRISGGKPAIALTSQPARSARQRMISICYMIDWVIGGEIVSATLRDPLSGKVHLYPTLSPVDSSISIAASSDPVSSRVKCYRELLERILELSPPLRPEKYGEYEAWEAMEVFRGGLSRVELQEYEVGLGPMPSTTRYRASLREEVEKVVLS